MDAAVDLSRRTGIHEACLSLGIPRATFYRQRPVLGPLPSGESPTETPTPQPTRPRPARALQLKEQQQVLAALHSERFQNLAPAAVHAQLLDEGQYLCSPRTMYRLLASQGEVRERRDQRTHPPYQKPELLATAPNQVWSWDITKLRGPVKWTYFYLYVVLDIFSRYVVGWMVAERESATLAQQLLKETIDKHGVVPGQLTIHSDRGRVMRSKSLALLYADLGIAKSFSRPYVSDDNPYSESQFRTLKYHPEFPDRFGCVFDVRAHCQVFFPWYNDEHRHSGLGMLTPRNVHYGETQVVLAQRQAALDAAYAAHPERFVRRPPAAVAPPTSAWINPPIRSKPEQETH
jgi:putative transposase